MLWPTRIERAVYAVARPSSKVSETIVGEAARAPASGSSEKIVTRMAATAAMFVRQAARDRRSEGSRFSLRGNHLLCISSSPFQYTKTRVFRRQDTYSRCRALKNPNRKTYYKHNNKIA